MIICDRCDKAGARAKAEFIQDEWICESCLKIIRGKKTKKQEEREYFNQKFGFEEKPTPDWLKSSNTREMEQIDKDIMRLDIDDGRSMEQSLITNLFGIVKDRIDNGYYTGDRKRQIIHIFQGLQDAVNTRYAPTDWSIDSLDLLNRQSNAIDLIQQIASIWHHEFSGLHLGLESNYAISGSEARKIDKLRSLGVEISMKTYYGSY